MPEVRQLFHILYGCKHILYVRIVKRVKLIMKNKVKQKCVHIPIEPLWGLIPKLVDHNYHHWMPNIKISLKGKSTFLAQLMNWTHNRQIRHAKQPHIGFAPPNSYVVESSSRKKLIYV